MNTRLPYDLRTAQTFSGVAIFLGAVMIALIFTPLQSLIHSLYSTYIYVISVFLAVAVPTAFFATVRYEKLVHVAFALLSLGVMGTMVFYVGAYNPFAVLWSILLVVCYLYSGRILFGFASLLLVAEVAISHQAYYPLTGELPATYVTLSYVISLVTIALSYVIALIIQRTNEKTRKLAESQRSEEIQLNRLNTLLNSIGDTVLTLNRYGRVTSENAAALSFFDTNQSLVGKNIDEVIHLKDAAMQDVSIRKLWEGMHSSILRDDLSIAADGEADIIRLSVQISPIHNTYGDDDGGYVLIIRDITRQKTLEDEKDEFISVTSHELRTPIAIAEGSLSNLLYMFERKADPEKLASSATAAHDQVLYLARMINDLSTLSRAERGVGDTPEEIDLNSLLHELYLRYQTEATAKSLTLNIDIDHLPTITTSRLYLEEILQNFITNAIKYTKEGTVTLSGKLAGGMVEFAVKDSGIGISKADQEKIFEKFFRSEDYRTRETSGTGLGLYVVRKLADKLSTRIEVESRLNHGSTFSIKLPASSTPPAGPPPPPASDLATIEAAPVTESTPAQPTVS